MASEYRYELKIPKDRIAVLIGKNGEVKREIEELTESRIEIDSKEGDVVFDPFAGSGTLGQCCMQTERSSIQIEIESKYIPKIVSRLENKELFSKPQKIETF